MKRRTSTFLALAALGIGLGLAHEHQHQGMEDHEHHHHDMEGHWMAPTKAAKHRNPVKADQASLNRGQALFQNHCASCHGAGGEGDGTAAEGLNPKPANLKEMSVHHSDGDLAWKIGNGRGAMPSWKGTLKSKQIWDLVNYIRRLGDS